MTPDLDLHARLAVEWAASGVRNELAEYWRGYAPAAHCAAAAEGLRAQSRLVRKIAPREADAILGVAALVGLLVDGAESARSANDINASDARIREALGVVETLRDVLGTKDTRDSSWD